LTLHLIDWIILLFYILLLIFLAGRLIRREKGDIEQFLVGGRRLTLPSFVATTVSTWYGGILGVGEYAYSYGLSNWLVFGVPYYLAALLFAALIAKRANAARLLTIPDQLQAAYGSPMAVGGAAMVFVMTVPAAYVFMLGVLLNLLFTMPLWLGVTIAAILSTFYVLIGGFRGDVRTDWVQFVLMYSVFAVMLIVLATGYGGWTFLKAHLPVEHFQWHGGNSPAYIASWYFIALAALIEPSFYQRAYAAKSPQVARAGILWSIPFWMLFDFMTTTVGLYSRAILGSGLSGVDAFPKMGDLTLSCGLKGLFLVGMIATIQSTVDSNSLLAASTLSHDILWRIKCWRVKISEVGLTRWGLIFSTALAVGIALWSESVVEIWHKLGSLGTPALMLPLALSYSQRWRYRPSWALANLIIAPLVVAIWFIMRSYCGKPPFPWMIEPIFIGLFVAGLLLGLDHLTRRKNSYLT